MQNPGGGMGPNETRNVIIAIVLSIGIFAGFEVFYNGPARERMQAEQRAQIAAQEQSQQQQQSADQTTGADGETAPATTSTGPVSRADALGAASARVAIDTNQVDGS
ncbi:MAG: hypothetical protein ABL932_06365, partial [Terricaulis sp.]